MDVCEYMDIIHMLREGHLRQFIPSFRVWGRVSFASSSPEEVVLHLTM
jgi:hypothetical protein